MTLTLAFLDMLFLLFLWTSKNRSCSWTTFSSRLRPSTVWSSAAGLYSPTCSRRSPHAHAHAHAPPRWRFCRKQVFKPTGWSQGSRCEFFSHPQVGCTPLHLVTFPIRWRDRWGPVPARLSKWEVTRPPLRWRCCRGRCSRRRLCTPCVRTVSRPSSPASPTTWGWWTHCSASSAFLWGEWGRNATRSTRSQPSDKHIVSVSALSVSGVTSAAAWFPAWSMTSRMWRTPAPTVRATSTHTNASANHRRLDVGESSHLLPVETDFPASFLQCRAALFYCQCSFFPPL